MAAEQGSAFKGRRFTSEVILWVLQLYLTFPISYRDLSAMLSDRRVSVDHTTLFCWIHAYAATLEQRARRHLRPCIASWRVDETYRRRPPSLSGPYNSASPKYTVAAPGCCA